jgi:hypothetical protein
MSRRRTVITWLAVAAAWWIIIGVIAANNTTPAPAIITGFVLPAVIAAAFLPIIVAMARHIDGIGQVVVINLLLGWTIIGWVIALVMAFRPKPPVPAAPFGTLSR